MVVVVKRPKTETGIHYGSFVAVVDSKINSRFRVILTLREILPNDSVSGVNRARLVADYGGEQGTLYLRHWWMD